jgi:MFS family permease
MTKFTQREKEVVSILSFGTFLEYFDFYLYFHFATVLNKLFFAVGDARSSALLTSFAYCTSFVFRPIGAFIFGHIGDNYGRKKVINITIFLMGISCVGIFFLPTYDSIGVWASVMLTFFRVIQGIATMGERAGGEVYLTEFLQGKKIFGGYLMLILMASTGCQIALYGIQLSLEGYFSWRYLFVFGLAIFIVGYFARRCLAETSDFVNSANVVQDKVRFKFYMASFFIECLGPVALFISVTGLNSIFTEVYHYSDLQITLRNLDACYFCILYNCIALLMYKKHSPFNMAMTRHAMGTLLLLVTPFLLTHYMSWELAIIIQSLWCFFCMGDMHIKPIMFKNSPIRKRVQVGILSFAFARALVAVITTFGILLLQPYLGYYVYILIGLPFFIAYGIAANYFRKLDEQNPNGVLKLYEEVK